jgi:hypothetical protein
VDQTDRPSDAAILERARSLVDKDDGFLTGNWPKSNSSSSPCAGSDLIATHVTTATEPVQQAITRFDAALPGLATLRNVGKNISTTSPSTAPADTAAASAAAQQLFHAIRGTQIDRAG